MTPITWQFGASETVEVVVALGGGRVAYRLVGPPPFPSITGLDRRLVRAALEHALERLGETDA